MLSEADFIDLNINIPHRAKKRILELVRCVGENLKQQKLTMETKQSPNKSRGNKNIKNNVGNLDAISKPKFSHLRDKIQNIRERY